MAEGFNAYEKAGFQYRLPEIKAARQGALEYLFSHSLFVGKDARYKKLAYPYRYRYDPLRFLDFCAAVWRAIRPPYETGSGLADCKAK